MRTDPEFQDLDAERALLGGMYAWPHLLRAYVPRLHPLYFNDLVHRDFFSALKAMHERAMKPCAESMKAFITEHGCDWAWTGAACQEILNGTPVSIDDMEFLCQRVINIYRATSAQEAMRGAGKDITADGYIATVKRAHDCIISVDGQQDTPISAVVDSVAKKMLAAQQSGGRLLGPSTGFRALDHMTLGLRPESLWILGGRPAHGKTSLGLQISDGVERAGGRPMFFSLEMPREELLMRILSQRTGIDGTKIQAANMNENQWVEATDELGRLKQSRWIIVDRAGLTIEDIVSSAVISHNDEPLSLVVVDYAQLIRHPANEQRYRAIGRIAAELYALAKDLHIPVLLLSQLSRSVEDGPKRRPRLSDLRESGDLEQHAAFVFFVHRPALQGANCQKSETEIILRKNRFGTTGIIKASMDTWATRFNEIKTDTGVEEDEPTD